jgi:hypothetical protein
MDILVHSLYSNRDVFLRELVSNASDALDKARVLALRRKAGVGAAPSAPSAENAAADGASPPAPPPPVADAEAAARNDDTLELAVRVWLDADGGVLNIRDTGVGMTRDELVKNLGTIARSGTSGEFIVHFCPRFFFLRGAAVGEGGRRSRALSLARVLCGAALKAPPKKQGRTKPRPPTPNKRKNPNQKKQPSSTSCSRAAGARTGPAARAPAATPR